MIERQGNLFNTELRVLGHGVNTVGVMGAGIAKAFRDKFDRNYRLYRDACHQGALAPGQFVVSSEGTITDETLVVNIASQRDPGPDARYLWLFEGTREAVRFLVRNGYNSMAIPRIGCGIGGLEWEKVKKILEVIEIVYPEFEFEVWSL